MLPADYRSPTTTERGDQLELQTRDTPAGTTGLVALTVLILAIIALIVIVSAGGDPSAARDVATTVPDGPLQ